MNSKLLPNGLSTRTNNLLTKAGVPIEKLAIIHALETGKLQVFRRPPDCGKYSHREVCQWAGVDPMSLPQTWQDPDTEIFSNIGLSLRAWRTLKLAGIPATQAAVRHALEAGQLWPYKRPGNYRKITHQEVCRWVGIDPNTLTWPGSTSGPYLDNGFHTEPTIV
jgi:hypothetical protein